MADNRSWFEELFGDTVIGQSFDFDNDGKLDWFEEGMAKTYLANTIEEEEKKRKQEEEDEKKFWKEMGW